MHPPELFDNAQAQLRPLWAAGDDSRDRQRCRAGDLPAPLPGTRRTPGHRGVLSRPLRGGAAAHSPGLSPRQERHLTDPDDHCTDARTMIPGTIASTSVRLAAKENAPGSALLSPGLLLGTRHHARSASTLRRAPAAWRGIDAHAASDLPPVTPAGRPRLHRGRAPRGVTVSVYRPASAAPPLPGMMAPRAAARRALVGPDGDPPGRGDLRPDRALAPIFGATRWGNARGFVRPRGASTSEGTVEHPPRRSTIDGGGAYCPQLGGGYAKHSLSTNRWRPT